MNIKKIKYPDGSFYPQIDNFDKEFTFFLNSYEDLWFLHQIRDIYKANGKNAIVTLPNLFDAQADDRFKENESFNLKLVCKFINDMNWEKVMVFHPHNYNFVKALIDKVEIIDNSNFINQVLESLGND